MMTMKENAYCLMSATLIEMMQINVIDCHLFSSHACLLTFLTRMCCIQNNTHLASQIAH